MKFLDVIVRGGVLMWPVLASALVGLVLAVERAIALRRVESHPAKFLVTVRTLALRRDMKGLLACCNERRSGMSAVIREGTTLYGQGEQSIRDAMESALGEQRWRLERRLPALAAATTITPVVGILGAIVGLIIGMKGVESHAVGVQHYLAGQLWSSLVPAATGLAFWIVLFIAYTYIDARVRRAASDMQAAKRDVERWFREPAGQETIHHVPPASSPQIRRSAIHDEDEYFRKKSEAGTR